ncbi:MAG: Crp/Fnr family transcriptional regulator [Bacteroidales bacterium]|nr:Crp/Fnr family transcriptional regulator [Bacteroidales bacterium]
MFIRNIEIPVEKCKIFCKINETLLEDAFNKIHFQIKSFPKGSIINTRNSTCNNMMIVLKGIVKTELSDLKGTTVHIADIFAADTLAPAFLFGKSNFIPVDTLAKTDVKILFIPKSEIYKLFNLCPQFLTNFLDLISTRTQYLVYKIRFLSFTTIKGKLAYYLLKLSEDQSSDIVKLNKTQSELAEDFGATRTSVARVIKQFINENSISVTGKAIELCDKKKISEYLKYEDHIHSWK